LSTFFCSWDSLGMIKYKERFWVSTTQNRFIVSYLIYTNLKIKPILHKLRRRGRALNSLLFFLISNSTQIDHTILLLFLKIGCNFWWRPFFWRTHYTFGNILFWTFGQMHRVPPSPELLCTPSIMLPSLSPEMHDLHREIYNKMIFSSAAVLMITG